MAKANSMDRGRAAEIAYSDDVLRLSSNNPDDGTVSTRLPCKASAPFAEIGMNGEYLRGLADAADKIGPKTLRLHLTAPASLSGSCLTRRSSAP